MKTYRLIKIYPGSRDLGYILKQVKNGEDKPNNYYLNGNWITPSNFPEHWEEVKELTLLEEAKLRYPIGTKFKNALQNQYTIYNNVTYEITSTGTFYQSTVESHGQVGVYFNNEWLYYNNQWAEIVDDFVLPEKWCIKAAYQKVVDYSNKYGKMKPYFLSDKHYHHYPAIGNGEWTSTYVIEQGYTEITFEQFKKYVLKEKTTIEFGNKVDEIIITDSHSDALKLQSKGINSLVLQSQKVVEKDYEILSFKLYKNMNKPCDIIVMVKPSNDIGIFLKMKDNYKIHSIKRLSDGQIFTVGIKIKTKYDSHAVEHSNIIKNISIINNKLSILTEINNKWPNGKTSIERAPVLLKNIVFIMKPLLITNDGIKIFNETDIVYGVSSTYWNTFASVPGQLERTKNWLNGTFSTKELAEEFVIMNKPLLSLSDVWDNLKVKDQKAVLEFVKTKIK